MVENFNDRTTVVTSEDLGDVHAVIVETMTTLLQQNEKNGSPLTDSEIFSGSTSVMIKMLHLLMGDEATIHFLQSWITMLSSHDGDTKQ